jgi:hypothetical protein
VSIRTRESDARLLAALLSLAFVAVLVAGCDLLGRDLRTGHYRAVIELPGGELPFGLDIERVDQAWALFLVNGAERIGVANVTVADGRLTAATAGAGNTITASIRGDRLDGEVTLADETGARATVPFHAERNQSWRFFETAASDNADVSGRWETRFIDEHGNETPGVAAFEQSFEQVTGEILTPTGDHRDLAGEVRGDELYLSCFDGTAARLYRLRIDESGDLVGDYWAGPATHRKLRAVRNPDALTDAGVVATGTSDPGDGR